ncbi:hypothetical protein EDB92DRAFT_1876307 [Lactarius akahatsu]|uniref:Uncharacterized protein n=1 Tax=Lactarius akahatsu TaxID=416441 RepID=A0AAD4LBZ1_9AGAM|nr:hypothetical protein EDB92DRAFT_1876307 [Lactarius akahatsu]
MTGWAKPELSLFAAVCFPCFRAHRYCNVCLIAGITNTCTCLLDATGEYIPMQIPPSLYCIPCPNKNGVTESSAQG